jgi:hypothetical protein
MIRHEPNRKHGATYKGPYLLTEVNDNGTVQLRSSNPTRWSRVPDLEYPKYTPL